MVYVIRQLFKVYSSLFLEYKDQRTDDWLIANTPFPTLIIIASYLYLSTSVGPKWMQNRKPYSLKYVIAFYNLFQVVGNLFLAIYAWRWSYWYEDFHFNCSLTTPPSDLSERGVMVVYGAYYYFILKLSDLLDTAFFVLRKQTNHVSFLHVYHHSIMTLTGYGATRFVPGGQATLLVLINCVVHVFMYAYYLGCSLHVSVEWVQWSKRHITHMQLVQFVVLAIHFFRSFVDKDCQYPKALSLILCIQNLFMMSMFLDFYRRTYNRQKFAKVKEKYVNNK